jgi:signal recognition particle GTPase
MMYPDSFDTYRRWLVTGGPGVGKTSMCVKLAIYLKRLGKQVVLSSIDSKKLLGQKELERYAKQIDVPYLPPDATLRDNRIIIFDTSAWDSNLPLKEAADEVRYDAALAVVDSRERFSEANLFLRKLHRTYQVKALAFSRVDLSETRGFIFDLLRSQKLPLLGISRGASFKVPFHFFEPTAFSNYIMGRDCE